MRSKYRSCFKAFAIVPEGHPFAFGVSESWSYSGSSLETATGDSKRAGAFPFDWRGTGQSSVSETCSCFTAGIVTSFIVGRLQRRIVKAMETKELNDIRNRPLFWSVRDLVRIFIISCDNNWGFQTCWRFSLRPLRDRRRVHIRILFKFHGSRNSHRLLSWASAKTKDVNATAAEQLNDVRNRPLFFR